MASTLNWQPAPLLIEQILQLAQQRGQSPETILTEAVLQYLETQPTLSNPQLNPASSDPLIGLFSSSPDLSTRAEEILEQEIIPQSGWSWK